MVGDTTPKRRIGKTTVLEDEQAFWSGLSDEHGDLNEMPAKYRAMAELGRLVRAAAEEEAVAAIECLADNPGVPVKEAIAKLRSHRVRESHVGATDLHALLLNIVNRYRDSHAISDEDTRSAVEALVEDCRQSLAQPPEDT